MTTSFLAFFGHINIDVSIRVPSLPKVGSVNAENVSENFGGTAGNFAIVANRLGLDFSLFSAVSPKTHSDYMKYLEDAGIPTDHVDIVRESYGPVCYITSDGNDQVAYVYQGPMEGWKPHENYDGSNSFNWVHFSTGPPEAYSGLFGNLGDAKVTFDPGQEIHYRYDRETAIRFITRADMFVGNTAEFGRLVEISGMDSGQIRENIGTVVITGGNEGVTLHHEGNTHHLNILPAERVHDTIGAGDSFRAGLYMGLFKGMSIVDSVAAGIIVSSKAIENPLTEFSMSWEDVKAIFREKRSYILRKEGF